MVIDCVTATWAVCGVNLGIRQRQADQSSIVRQQRIAD
jgi:hypothetical protein